MPRAARLVSIIAPGRRAEASTRGRATGYDPSTIHSVAVNHKNRPLAARASPGWSLNVPAGRLNPSTRRSVGRRRSICVTFDVVSPLCDQSTHASRLSRNSSADCMASLTLSIRLSLFILDIRPSVAAPLLLHRLFRSIPGSRSHLDSPQSH